MGKYGAFKRNFDFSGLSPLEAQKMLGYVELMNQCMDRARIAANNAVGNYQNYYCCYEQKMEADLTLANFLLSHIGEAVAKGWIKVYYQPIVDTFGSKISTYEALARWIDPNYGFLNPGEFIEVLERGHLIHKLDLHILDLVCQDLEEAMQKGETYPMISVNLSRYDLELPDLHERVNTILSRHGVKAPRSGSKSPSRPCSAVLKPSSRSISAASMRTATRSGWMTSAAASHP